MVAIGFRRIQSAAVLKADPLASDQALALASAPGGCPGNRYPIFVELEASTVAGFQRGGFCAVEFILPGKPGRWRATGEIVAAVGTQKSQGSVVVPAGLGLELLGLALTSEVLVAPEPTALVSEPAPPVESAADPQEPEPEFDASQMVIEISDAVAMLRDLLGRDVEGQASSVLADKIGPHDVVACYCDDDGEVIFAIAFDKACAARIGGALTMLPVDSLDDAIKGKGALTGEPMENAKEVLNIMSALFHEAESPHVVLAETVLGADLADAAGGELQALLDNKVWSLSLKIDIEDYGMA